MKVDKKIVNEMISFRRWMHQNPELSGHEKHTVEKIAEILELHDIEYYATQSCYGIVAIVRGKKGGITVAAKTDIDALPITEDLLFDFSSNNKGVMHACGHDANTAILLGTAIWFKNIEDSLSGNVKFFFEPAEETIGGGSLMVEEGCMENPKVKKIIGVHVMPQLDVGEFEIKKGCLNANTNEVEIVVHGKGGHAAEPEKCIDPIVVLAHIIVALQTFVSRSTSPTDSAVLTFGYIVGGTKGNIIPNEATIKGTLRTLWHEQREDAKIRIKEIANGVASGFGASAEVNIKDSYDAVINDDEIVDIICNEIENEYGKSAIILKKEPSMGAEDFSYYTKNSKGAYFHIGCRNKEYGECNLHTPEFVLDEESIEHGINIQFKVLMRLLTD